MSIRLFELETNLAIILNRWGTWILSLDLTFDMNEELISCQWASAASVFRIQDQTNERKLSIGASKASLLISWSLPASSLCFFSFLK